MTQLPLLTLFVSVVTLLVLSYTAGSFVRIYDLLTLQNKRIALASVFCVFFACLEHGTRSFCVLFGLPMPELLGLLETGNGLFLCAWLLLTLLEMKSTLHYDFTDSLNRWKRFDL